MNQYKNLQIDFHESKFYLQPQTHYITVVCFFFGLKTSEIVEIFDIYRLIALAYWHSDLWNV